MGHTEKAITQEIEDYQAKWVGFAYALRPMARSALHDLYASLRANSVAISESNCPELDKVFLLTMVVDLALQVRLLKEFIGFHPEMKIELEMLWQSGHPGAPPGDPEQESMPLLPDRSHP